MHRRPIPHLRQRSLLRHPARTARAVLGVAATVTVVTTFAVGIASFQRAVHEHYLDFASQPDANDVLTTVATIVLVLTAILGLTSTIALGNAVSFSTWLRRRDTALLRILGQSSKQTRGAVRSIVLVAIAATVAPAWNPVRLTPLRA